MFGSSSTDEYLSGSDGASTGTAAPLVTAGTVNQIHYLVRQRAITKGLISKLYDCFVDPVSDISSLSRESLIVKEERLRNSFKKYEDLNLRIAGLDSHDKEDVDHVEEQYQQTLTTIMTRLNCLQKDSNHIICTESASEVASPRYLATRLPEIVVPPFTGRYSEYMTFKGLFDSLIDQNIGLEKIQKFYYLCSFLSGEPLDLVRNLPLVSESYDEGIKILDDRYNNGFKIRNDHINMLLDIPHMNKSTAPQIRQFVSIVKQQLAALKNMKCSVSQWDPIILCMLLRKLDLFCSREFHLVCAKDQTVQSLIEFLEKRARAYENSER